MTIFCEKTECIFNDKYEYTARAECLRKTGINIKNGECLNFRTLEDVEESEESNE